MISKGLYFLTGLFAFQLVLCGCVLSQSNSKQIISRRPGYADSPGRSELRIRVVDQRSLGARVLVNLEFDGSLAFSAYSDWSGNVAFQGLVAGKYAVVIVLNGQEIRREMLTLAEGENIQSEVIRLSAFTFTDKTDKTSVNDLRAPAKAYNLYLEGLEAIRSGHLEQARKDLDDALKIYPVHSQSHNARGVILHMSRRNDEAEQEFRAAIRFDPKAFEPRFNLGKLLLECNKPAEAKQALQRALELDKESESVATIELLVDSMLLTHDVQSAISLTESLQRKGVKYPARIDLGIAWELYQEGKVESGD
jgi:Tfp pilus assembly protein PilF